MIYCRVGFWGKEWLGVVSVGDRKVSSDRDDLNLLRRDISPI